ncbi:hypothetical protein EVAR_25088_1 [Eumeta japonica]|uniref:Uncharacterized protein n=1 Tax=Eumeta variegata TaxID=151549 RepID=A0A4C1Z1R2_EUMVA|nr:hypothetical protein EVAR_25088_1 [Eumeta japonica]
MGSDIQAHRRIIVKKFAKLAGRVEFLVLPLFALTTPVRDALQNLHEETNDSVAASDLLSLIQNMEQFEFIVTIVAWYDILFQVNIVSKAMQSEMMDLPNASQLLKTIRIRKQYRRSFSSTIITAKEIASLAEINPVLRQSDLEERNARCVKCLGNHGITQCTRNKDRDQLPACVLSKEKGHTADYLRCPRAPKKAPAPAKVTPP